MSRLFSAQSSQPPLAWWAHNASFPRLSTPHAAQRLIALQPEAILHLANVTSGDTWRRGYGDGRRLLITTKSAYATNAKSNTINHVCSNGVPDRAGRRNLLNTRAKPSTMRPA